MIQRPEAKFRFVPPEILRGESLVKRVTDLSMRALIETYPILSNSPYFERLPNFDRICFTSLDQIREKQKNDKPPTNMLFLGLKLTGIPESVILQRYYPLIEDYPVYWNLGEKNPSIYFSDKILSDLSSPHPGIRATEAMIFGTALIKETLGMLPTPQKLSQTDWVAMAETDMADLFKLLEKDFDGQFDPKNFSTLKQNTGNLLSLDRQAAVLSYGAMALLLFADQSINTAEYTMGYKFHWGTVCYLAQDVIRKFIILMKNALIAPNSFKLSDFYAKLLSPTEPQYFAQNILRHIQLVDFTNKQKLLELYLNSELPIYYHNSPKKGLVNPWQYPH
ncbi:hypothetical protein HYU94_03340 [Candidatus Daviesbacteria bacterium]|nr:hypothetical protein [Candidatus Daviesbacteria bacterium]